MSSAQSGASGLHIVLLSSEIGRRFARQWLLCLRSGYTKETNGVPVCKPPTLQVLLPKMSASSILPRPTPATLSSESVHRFVDPSLSFYKRKRLCPAAKQKPKTTCKPQSQNKMPFLAQKHLPISNKDVLSWIFDEPKYDLDKPVSPAKKPV